MRAISAAVVAVVALVGCSTPKPENSPSDTLAKTVEGDSARPVASPGGFEQPEAVRYDPDQDLYFVGNWGPGAPDAIDNNGFISKMRPDGSVEQSRFVGGGTGGATLHAPRGMTITGDTLWVVDADAVRGFNRRTGAPLATANFSAYKLGFLNDIAAGTDGEYVTDTGTNQIYRIAGGRVTVALRDSTLGGPNGITWDAKGRRFIVVPWGTSVIKAWSTGGKTLNDFAKSAATKFDGVEILSGDRVLVSSQSDSSLHLFRGGSDHAIIHTGGAPADIAIDTKRNRVAVPFVDRGIVEIWKLPSQ
jgi:hypothetical protein